jgi:hypothetical protein
MGLGCGGVDAAKGAAAPRAASTKRASKGAKPDALARALAAAHAERDQALADLAQARVALAMHGVSLRDELGADGRALDGGNGDGESRGGVAIDIGGGRTGARAVALPMGPTHATNHPTSVVVSGKEKASLGTLPRAKKASVVGALRERLSADPRLRLQIVDALVARASGSTKAANDAAKIILDRVDGPVTKEVNMTGERHVVKSIYVEVGPELRAMAESDPYLDLGSLKVVGDARAIEGEADGE